jgi:hypothetical protein
MDSGALVWALHGGESMVIVTASNTATVTDSLTKSADFGKRLSDALAVTDNAIALKLFGGTVKESVAVTDMVSAEILNIGTDVVSTADSLQRVVCYVRTASDASDVEDSIVEGELVFVPYGDDASVGPIVMLAVDNAGPLSISGGPDLSTGPVGFVTRKGDFVEVTDQMIQGMSLAVEFIDSVEATG